MDIRIVVQRCALGSHTFRMEPLKDANENRLDGTCLCADTEGGGWESILDGSRPIGNLKGKLYPVCCLSQLAPGDLDANVSVCVFMRIILICYIVCSSFIFSLRFQRLLCACSS